MTSRKPYLIRGLYEWLLDNEVTPFILVDTSLEQVSIPKGIATDGKVVLNLAPGAIQNLEMTNQYLSFSARFNGVAQDIYCPMASVLAIYARENGEGMMFSVEEIDDQADDSGNTDEDGNKGKKSRPGLKVVK
ncbi:MAG: ClpXP protease specificity-enhancing factor [Gammaproteobacteria bacterium]|nr:ClpXP protease specificity-enhancing factor [Gammaproteobacteria bacterium]